MKREFFAAMLIAFYFGLSCLIIGDSLSQEQPTGQNQNIQEVLINKKIETDRYCIQHFTKEEGEETIDFMKRVMDFAAKQRIYDVTYTRSSVFVKTIKICVVTSRRPEVTFKNTFDEAVVMWWKLQEHYPEDIKDFLKRYKKDKERNTK